MHPCDLHEYNVCFTGEAGIKGTIGRVYGGTKRFKFAGDLKELR